MGEEEHGSEEGDKTHSEKGSKSGDELGNEPNAEGDKSDDDQDTPLDIGPQQQEKELEEEERDLSKDPQFRRIRAQYREIVACSRNMARTGKGQLHIQFIPIYFTPSLVIPSRLRVDNCSPSSWQAMQPFDSSRPSSISQRCVILHTQRRRWLLKEADVFCQENCLAHSLPFISSILIDLFLAYRAAKAKETKRLFKSFTELIPVHGGADVAGHVDFDLFALL